MSKSFVIPETPKEWSQLALVHFDEDDPVTRSKGLRALNPSEWNSASKMQAEHFVLLRAHWTRQTVRDFKLDDFIGSREISEARQKVTEADTTFREYVNTLKKRLKGKVEVGMPAPRDCGMFALVLYQQDQISRLTSRPANAADAELQSVPKVNMTPRYVTRSSTRPAPQESPTPKPSADRGNSSTLDLTNNMEALALTQSNSRSPPTHSPKENEPRTPEGEASGSSSLNIGSGQTELSQFSQFSASQIKAASDEQIVNAALTSFLQALTMYDNHQVEWAIDRSIFRMDELYEARTDGCLLQRGSNLPLAILETKAHVRKPNATQIMVQETAQMAAWIRSQPEHGELRNGGHEPLRRRLLISQDNREMYLIIAEYSEAYKEYLRETSVASPPPDYTPGTQKAYTFDWDNGPMLKMRSYGPFDIKRDDHMRSFAIAVVAFTSELEAGIIRS